MSIVLASGSERRRALLSWLGIPFKVVESNVDESAYSEKDPERLVSRLAREKAQAVAEQLRVSDRQDSLVIGADTIVYVDNEIVGKPQDAEDAARILRKLSDKTHKVYTGVAVVDARGGDEKVAVEKTGVRFRKLSEKEIRSYVATGEPLDKGGAYAIQMGAKGFVEGVEGSYTNVVGLPLTILVRLLRDRGYAVEKDVSKIVFEKTGYRS